MVSTRGLAAWLTLGLTAALMLPAGFLAQRYSASAVRELEALALADPLAGSAAAQDALRGLAFALAGTLTAGSALLARYFQQGLRQREFPPRGWWPLASHRVLRAGDAQRIGRTGLALALAGATLGALALLLVAPLFELFLR